MFFPPLGSCYTSYDCYDVKLDPTKRKKFWNNINLQWTTIGFCNFILIEWIPCWPARSGNIILLYMNLAHSTIYSSSAAFSYISKIFLCKYFWHYVLSNFKHDWEMFSNFGFEDFLMVINHDLRSNLHKHVDVYWERTRRLGPHGHLASHKATDSYSIIEMSPKRLGVGFLLFCHLWSGILCFLGIVSPLLTSSTSKNFIRRKTSDWKRNWKVAEHFNPVFFTPSLNPQLFNPDFSTMNSLRTEVKGDFNIHGTKYF